MALGSQCSGPDLAAFLGGQEHCLWGSLTLLPAIVIVREKEAVSVPILCLEEAQTKAGAAFSPPSFLSAPG